MYPGLPKKVKVGGMSFGISTDASVHLGIEESAGERVYGQMDPTAARIVLHPGMADSRARQVMVHELLHAAIFSAGLGLTDEVEEPIVRALEGPVLQILRDNPALVKWLTDKD